jgi:hypothetical protein
VSYHFNFRAVFNNFDLPLEGMLLTLPLSAITMALGLAVGIVMALLRTWGPRPLRWVSRVLFEPCPRAFAADLPFAAATPIVDPGIAPVRPRAP